jgi:hypothetical protein
MGKLLLIKVFIMEISLVGFFEALDIMEVTIE